MLYGISAIEVVYKKKKTIVINIKSYLSHSFPFSKELGTHN